MKLESHLRAKMHHITYSNNSYSNTAVATGDFVKRYTVGERVSLPFELETTNK
jgi:hypothetical protein